ncbi:MAG TPA: hypothetical protein VL096_11115 [Pirellulaceae bacterium]|nr:hypothetical protein [Pirellulaceae bacterium]
MVTTSKNAPRLPAEILAQEKAQATEAMRATLNEMWNQVPSQQQVWAWAQENPLLAAGVVAGAGALAGAVLTPSDRRAAPVVVREPVAAAAAQGSIFSMLLGQALPMLSMVAGEAGRNALLAALMPQANGANATTGGNVAPVAGDGAGI